MNLGGTISCTKTLSQTRVGRPRAEGLGSLRGAETGPSGLRDGMVMMCHGVVVFAKNPVRGKREGICSSMCAGASVWFSNCWRTRLHLGDWLSPGKGWLERNQKAQSQASEGA
jgi:hypothetical protein